MEKWKRSRRKRRQSPGKGSSEESGKKAAGQETDSISGAMPDDTGETSLCGEESETIPAGSGNITFETDSIRSRDESAFTEVRVSGKRASSGADAENRREIMPGEMDFAKKRSRK